MPRFSYRARDKNGSLATGLVEASTMVEAKQILSGRGLVVTGIAAAGIEQVFERVKVWLKGFTEKVSLEELIVFNRQLQTSYSVGISMVQALTLIADQTPNPRLKAIIGTLIEDLSEGKALHEAMAKFPDVFDSIYVNAVKAGESSGKLEDIFGMLCYFAEQKVENEAKIKSATLYPKIILFTIGVVMLTVFTYVMPKLKDFYGKFGGELPALTQFVMGISEFVVGYWYLLALAAAGIYFSGKKYLESRKGRMMWHSLQLKLPIFGPIFLFGELLTFAIVLRLLIQSGLPIMEAFTIVRDSLKNQVLKDEVESCGKAVEAGRSVASGFSQSKVFPKMVGNLMSVGEESGKIDEVLEKVGSYYKLQLEYRLNNLSKAIEPVFLFLIFGIVLVLVLAIFLPIWKMSQLVRVS